mmetsp:Transcript_21289/g.51518  ORF Transcript_21289/g.51518 Transcript_21289/m.51518 type:complete len:532 (-) Transcript_21289:72-1667(-)
MRSFALAALLAAAGHVRRDDGPGHVSVLIDDTAYVRRTRAAPSDAVLLEGTAPPEEDTVTPADNHTTLAPADDPKEEDKEEDDEESVEDARAEEAEHDPAHEEDHHHQHAHHGGDHPRPTRRAHPIAENCALGNFSDWYPCSVPCGGGEQTREKLILVEGKACPENRTETRACNPQKCNGTNTTVHVAVVRVHLAYLGTPAFAATIRRAVAGFLGAAPSRVSIVTTQDVVEENLPGPQHEMTAVVLEVAAHSTNATARKVWADQAVRLLQQGRDRPVVFAKAVRSQIDVDHEGDVEFRADRDVGIMMLEDPVSFERTVLKTALPSLSTLVISEIGMEEPTMKRQELEEVEAVEAGIPMGLPGSAYLITFGVIALIAQIGTVAFALHLRRQQQLQFLAHGDLVTYKVHGEEGTELKTREVVDVLTDHTTGEVTKLAVEEDGKTKWLEQDEVTAVVTDSEDESSESVEDFDETPPTRDLPTTTAGDTGARSPGAEPSTSSGSSPRPPANAERGSRSSTPDGSRPGPPPPPASA